MLEPMSTGTRAFFFDPSQLGELGRFSRPHPGADHSVHQKKLRLFDLIDNVQITRERMGAMFLLHVAEDFDVLAVELFALAQKLARAAFNQSAPPTCAKT